MTGTLLADFSLDMGGKEVAELQRVRALVPPRSAIHIGFTGSDDMPIAVRTARAVRESGYMPVAIIPARRLTSERMLGEYLAGLRAAEASGSVLVVAGDLAQPRGPYPDAVSVIRSGLLEGNGVRQVSLAVHPAGHPAAPADVAWQALADKTAELEKRGLAGSLITQFGFDPDLVLDWLASVRARGVTLPVRVGVPGPAGVRRLLWYASRCDVSVSAAAAGKYGIREFRGPVSHCGRQPARSRIS